MTPFTDVSPVAQPHFESHLNARRSAVGEKHVFQAWRRQADKFSRQLLGRLVCEFGEDYLIQNLRLRLDGGDNAGMTVPMCNYPPGAYSVYHLLPVLSKEVRSVSSRNHRQFRA